MVKYFLNGTYNWFHNLNALNQLQCALLPYSAIVSFHGDNFIAGLGWSCAIIYFIAWTTNSQKFTSIFKTTVNYHLYADKLEMKSISKKDFKNDTKTD